ERASKPWETSISRLPASDASATFLLALQMEEHGAGLLSLARARCASRKTPQQLDGLGRASMAEDLQRPHVADPLHLPRLALGLAEEAFQAHVRLERLAAFPRLPDLGDHRLTCLVQRTRRLLPHRELLVVQVRKESGEMLRIRDGYRTQLAVQERHGLV